MITCLWNVENWVSVKPKGNIVRLFAGREWFSRIVDKSFDNVLCSRNLRLGWNYYVGLLEWVQDGEK